MLWVKYVVNPADNIRNPQSRIARNTIQFFAWSPQATKQSQGTMSLGGRLRRLLLANDELVS